MSSGHYFDTANTQSFSTEVAAVRIKMTKSIKADVSVEAKK